MVHKSATQQAAAEEPGRACAEHGEGLGSVPSASCLGADFTVDLCSLFTPFRQYRAGSSTGWQGCHCWALEGRSVPVHVTLVCCTMLKWVVAHSCCSSGGVAVNAGQGLRLLAVHQC